MASQPEVEFFMEEVDGTEYLNVGLTWECPEDLPLGRGELHAVLGAFKGDLDQEAMVIIKGLVEQACIYTLGLNLEF